MPNEDHLETELILAGEEGEHPYGAIIPPIVQTSLFTAPTLEAFREGKRAMPCGNYTRVSNPTTEIVEKKLALLEGADRALCFSSGMTAITTAVLSCVRAGDHLIAPSTAYPPARHFMENYLSRFQVSTTLVEGLCLQEFEAAIRPNTRVIYLESPSSLFFHLQDIRAVAQLAKRHGVLTICDNSWATPFFQNPLAYGADLVVHSASKYLGGHSDLVAGVVAGRAEYMEEVHRTRTLLGGILDPFAAWLLLRGLRTLPVRMERHQQNGLKVARFLARHPAVSQVNHPGLPSHPQHELARRQLRGYSSLFSFKLHETADARVKQFVNNLRLFRIGVSWGGFESLVNAIRIEQIDENHGRWLVRLHIGLEDPADLIRDLKQALKGMGENKSG